MSDTPEFVLDREFDAPRELVWRAWTDPKLLHRWYGPGVETVIHKFDLEPDGEWLNEMKMKGGSSFQKMIFKEIAKPEKLVWHHCSTDADWNICRQSDDAGLAAGLANDGDLRRKGRPN